MAIISRSSGAANRLVLDDIGVQVGLLAFRAAEFAFIFNPFVKRMFD
jgi:hypothetical protein